MSEEKYYVDRAGNLHMIQQNPCGCHPYDIIWKAEWHHKTRWARNGTSISFRSQRAINTWIKDRKLELLK